MSRLVSIRESLIKVWQRQHRPCQNLIQTDQGVLYQRPRLVVPTFETPLLETLFSLKAFIDDMSVENKPNNAYLPTKLVRVVHNNVICLVETFANLTFVGRGRGGFSQGDPCGVTL